MSARIGPTFSTELVAAGLSLDGIAWDETAGVITACPADLVDQVQAVLAKHDPTQTLPTTQYTFLDFLGLFTGQEQAAIVASTNVQVRLFCLMAAGASFVDLTDPRVVTGTQGLEALSLIASGRAKQVLAGQPPPT